MTRTPEESIWEAVRLIPIDPQAPSTLQSLCDTYELGHIDMHDELVAIHLFSHLINYNFLAAKNYSKKFPKETREKHLFVLVWRLCKAIGQKNYKDIPEIIAKISNNEKYQPIARAATHWHNKRMWDYVENGFETISLDNIGKLGIICPSLADELKIRGYIVEGGYVYPKRQEPEKPQINAAVELKALAETMRSLEAL